MSLDTLIQGLDWLKRKELVEHNRQRIERVNGIPTPKGTLPPWAYNIEAENLDKRLKVDPRIRIAVEKLQEDPELRNLVEIYRNLRYQINTDIGSLAASGLFGETAQKIYSKTHELSSRRDFLISVYDKIRRDYKALYQPSQSDLSMILGPAAAGGILAHNTNYSNREFLKVLGLVSGGLVLVYCNGGGGGNPTQPTRYVSFENAVSGLINQIPVNGTLKIQNGPNISIVNGKITVTEEHKLEARTYTAIIETNEGILRQTPIIVDTHGMYINLNDGRENNQLRKPYDKGHVLLDVFDVTDVEYERYKRSALHLGQGSSERWAESPKFYIWDRTVFRRLDIGIEKYRNEGMRNQTRESFYDVFLNDMVQLFATIYPSGGSVILESQNPDGPDPNLSPDGYYNVYSVINPFQGRLVSAGVKPPRDGKVTYFNMETDHQRDVNRGGALLDSFEGLRFGDAAIVGVGYQQNGQLTQEARNLFKMKYHRKMGQKSMPGIPDYQG